MTIKCSNQRVALEFWQDEARNLKFVSREFSIQLQKKNTLVKLVMLLGALAAGDAKATCYAQNYTQDQCNAKNVVSQTMPTNNTNPDWSYCYYNQGSPSSDGKACQWTDNNGWGGYCYPGCVPPTLSKARSTLRHGL